MKIWFGGYTSHSSKGIYEGSISLNNNNSKITNIKNIIETGKPTYFQFNDNLLFTIAQEGQDQAGIESYKRKGNNFIKVDSFMHKGAAPCYLGIDKKNKFIFTANYHLGTVNIFSFDTQGKLTFIAKDTHKGSGPRPEQDSAHPHFFDRTPAGHLVSCDLGTDTVDFYDLQNNQLIHLASYNMEKGFGTRHLAFSPDGKTMYIDGELSSKVNVAAIDEENWTFKNLNTYSTIPSDYSEHNGAAAVRLTKDGKYLYVSNRGHDSITVFKTVNGEKLDLVQRISVFGSFPRDFNWDESEKYLVATNQNSDNATLYLRNAENGTLTPIQKDIQVPETTRVLFTKD